MAARNIVAAGSAGLELFLDVVVVRDEAVVAGAAGLLLGAGGAIAQAIITGDEAVVADVVGAV